MGKYSDKFHQRNLKKEDKRIIDNLFKSLESMKFNRQADILHYFASNIHKLCKSGFDSPLWSSESLNYIVNYSIGNDIKRIHSMIKLIIDRGVYNKRMVDSGIFSSYTLKKEKEFDPFKKEMTEKGIIEYDNFYNDIIYLRIDDNRSNKRKFIIKIQEDDATICTGHYKKSFNYKDIRDDNFIMGYSYDYNKELSYNNDALLYTYQDFKIFCLVLTNIFLMVRDNDY